MNRTTLTLSPAGSWHYTPSADATAPTGELAVYPSNNATQIVATATYRLEQRMAQFFTDSFSEWAPFFARMDREKVPTHKSVVDVTDPGGNIRVFVLQVGERNDADLVSKIRVAQIEQTFCIGQNASISPNTQENGSSIKFSTYCAGTVKRDEAGAPTEKIMYYISFNYQQPSALARLGTYVRSLLPSKPTSRNAPPARPAPANREALALRAWYRALLKRVVSGSCKAFNWTYETRPVRAVRFIANKVFGILAWLFSPVKNYLLKPLHDQAVRPAARFLLQKIGRTRHTLVKTGGR